MKDSAPPQILVHPGVYVQRECEARDICLTELAGLLSWEENHLQQVLSGQGDVTVELAHRLQHHLGIPMDLLMHLQKDFEAFHQNIHP